MLFADKWWADMKAIFLLSALLPLLFLTGCGDGWPKVGDRVLYGLGKRGEEEITGKEWYYWIAEKTENTITFRTLTTAGSGHPDGHGLYAYATEEVMPLSRVPRVEKHVDQVPMPAKDFVGPVVPRDEGYNIDVINRALDALENQRQ